MRVENCQVFLEDLEGAAMTVAKHSLGIAGFDRWRGAVSQLRFSYASRVVPVQNLVQSTITAAPWCFKQLLHAIGSAVEQTIAGEKLELLGRASAGKKEELQQGLHSAALP